MKAPGARAPSSTCAPERGERALAPPRPRGLCANCPSPRGGAAEARAGVTREGASRSRCRAKVDARDAGSPGDQGRCGSTWDSPEAGAVSGGTRIAEARPHRRRVAAKRETTSMMSKITAPTGGAKKTTSKAPAKRASRSPSAATPSRARPTARKTRTTARKTATTGPAKTTRARPAAKRKATTRRAAPAKSALPKADITGESRAKPRAAAKRAATTRRPNAATTPTKRARAATKRAASPRKPAASPRAS